MSLKGRAFLISLNKNRKGMTLVEILITASIIVLIATMLIPSFVLARKKTRRAICLNNLRILQGVGERYCIDEKVSDLLEITQDDLLNSEYIKEKAKCPEGNVEYSSFVIRDGPVCPNLDRFPEHQIGD
jgi:prepilin-type N-terminal cleavage/methylation domain-containing protein